MRSAVYEGWVTHHRRHPLEHRFAYRVVLPLLYLDEISPVCRLHPLWSEERPNVVSYRRRDFLGAGSEDPAGAAHRLAPAAAGGRVALLAHLRTWGWLFNPVALYYCFDRDGGVAALVAEVTNTPWHERHVYVVGEPGRHRFDKELHVSPFFGMDMDYELQYCEPGDRLSLSMQAMHGGEVTFRAHLRLRRHELDRRALSRLVWGRPFSTIRVSTGIYRQALALWRAGAPFVPHPRDSSAPHRSRRAAEPPEGHPCIRASVVPAPSQTVIGPRHGEG